MEVSKRKFTSVVLAIVFISVLLTGTAFYVFGAQPTQEFWATSGPYPSEPSYVIWKVDSTYYAKDQQGELVSTSSNVTAVFEVARDGLAAGGGLIWFREGDFLIDTTLGLLTVETRNIWIGGTHESKIKAADNANLDAVLEIRFSHKGNTIRGITVDGNSANSGADVGILIASDAVAPATWVDIIEVNFINCPIAILTTTEPAGFQQEHVLIDKCKFGILGEVNGIGIYLNYSRATRVTGNIIEDCTNIGVLGNHSNNIIFSENHLDDNINYGVYLDDSGSWSINSNFFEDTINYDHVFLDSGSADNVLSNNVMDTDPPGRDNFHIEGQRNVIQGNTFFTNGNGAFVNLTSHKNQVIGNSMQGSADYGIVLTSDYNLIEANFIGDCTYGILEQAGADYNTIIGNRVHGSVTEDIIIVGANTKANLNWNGTTTWVP